jgi:hypothetical protein
MEIKFEGFLVFAELKTPKPERMVVMLMNHPDHEPLLSVPKNKYLRDESGLQPPSDSGNFYCFDLVGRTVTSLGSGVPARTIDDVPRLKRAFPQASKPNGTVKKGKPDPARFHAAFELPSAGALTIIGYYDNDGTFDNGTTTECIPRALLYKVAVSDPVTFYIGDVSNTVVVEPDAVVSITNKEPSASASPHYARYKYFVDDTISVENLLKPTGKDCSKPPSGPVASCTGAADLDVGCSPVRYP